jgi:hypothetical protein
MASEVGNIIFQQLGGQRFIGMTGANNFVHGTKSLTFRIPNRSINMVEIKLNGTDQYDVTYYRYARLVAKPVKVETDIDAEMLQERFTEVTGLDTHL